MPDSPLLRGEELGEGSDPSSIRQQYLSSVKLTGVISSVASLRRNFVVSLIQ